MRKIPESLRGREAVGSANEEPDRQRRQGEERLLPAGQALEGFSPADFEFVEHPVKGAPVPALVKGCGETGIVLDGPVAVENRLLGDDPDPVLDFEIYLFR
jgi:hypothetical protein